MADIEPDATPWLAVIAKSLAFLCLSKEVEQEPEKYKKRFVAKVKFLQGLGFREMMRRELREARRTL